ncbi:MAG: hypothetical protein HQL41_15260, partial [Alphaproteobacteria bacterium]|nr:hypothetical protein [Alphaproteobacteria bacterium]
RFAASPPLLSLLGVGAAEATAILEALGYEAKTGPEGLVTFARARRARRPQAGRRHPPPPESPFAGLKALAG